jgi:hypothetical protein
MDHIVLLTPFEVRQLLAELQMADSKGQNGIRKLRVWSDGTTVKFKVNSNMWSPPMGKLDPECAAAQRVRDIDAVNEANRAEWAEMHATDEAN